MFAFRARGGKMKKKTFIYDDLKTQNYYAEIIRSGFQEKPKTSYTCIKPNFVLEYFVDGEGTIQIDNKIHKVKKGDLILWPCNKLIISTPSSSNPFEYWWFDFFGPKISFVLKQVGFTDRSPVLHCDDDKIAEFMKTIHLSMKNNTLSSRLSALGSFFELLSYLVSLKKNITFERNFVDIYIEKAIWFIQHYFKDDIKTTDIANHVNISVSYLNAIFTKKVGTSPIDFLINYRIEQAQNMLTTPNLSATLISQNCGFNSPSYFTQKFKEITGMTPKEYQKNNNIK